MKDNSYIVIQAFMLNDLGLKGNELIVYAVIYGFTQDGNHWYYGTRNSLAEWCGATKGTVSNCLKSLMEKGYIRRREVDLYGYVQVQYQAVTEIVSPYQKLIPDPIKNYEGGVSKIDTIDTKDDIKEEYTLYSDIVGYLNAKAGTSYKDTSDKTRRLIDARMRDGYSPDDFKRVIDSKCREWLETDMRKYIRPETLFGPKFEGYLQTAPQTLAKPKRELPDTLPCPKCGAESKRTAGYVYYCRECDASWGGAMIDKTNEHLLGKPSIIQDACCVCGMPASDNHHVIPKGMGGSKLAKMIPTVALCGMGNTCGCHGEAHAGLLHFDYRDGRWMYLRTPEPSKRVDIIDSDSWRECLVDGS